MSRKKKHEPAIRSLSLTGLLSFGDPGCDLKLGPLNVLIGPNGSGKSNFVEALAILRAAPRNVSAPIKVAGGVLEWLHKGSPAATSATIFAEVSDSRPTHTLNHGLVFAEHGQRFEILKELIYTDSRSFDYSYSRTGGVLRGGPKRTPRRLLPKEIDPEQSILSQVRDPQRYPGIARLQQVYEGIHLYRNWSFGPDAPIRKDQSAHGRGDILEDSGANLALVLSHLRLHVKPQLLNSIEIVYEGAVDISIATDGGVARLFLEEAGGRQIPASRLSDGTLRYLCLLAILLHPEPPPVIVIDEPELGLHPDLVEHLAKLLVHASERTQLIVTTHSRDLVSAFSKSPEVVIVCESRRGQTHFERLSALRLKGFLDKYSLGDLWSIGELGGNRW